MKTMKLNRIFVLILSLALLIGSAVCVIASADEGDYAIKSINIAHGDQIKVLVAVDAPAGAGENITVSYVFNGETYEATYWQDMDIYDDGTLYPVFYTVGIPAKDISETIVAKVGNGEAKEISVADYLYIKLVKEGYEFAIEEEDVARKNLYKNLLDYGSQAQQVLWNNKPENADNQRVLANSITPVLLADGAAIAGETGLVKLTSAGYLNLDYTGSDMLVGWNVMTADGTEFFYSNVYVEGGARVTPVTMALGGTTETFEGDYTTDDGTTRYNEIYFPGGFEAKSSPNGDGTTNSNQKAAVNYQEGRGKYLQITSDVRVGNERAHIVNAPQVQVVGENPNVTIAEFDFKDNSAAYYDVEFSLGGNVYALGRTIGASSTSNPYIALPQNEWYTLRLEAYHNEDVLQVYVNNVYLGSLTTAMAGTAVDITDSKHVQFGAYNGSRTVDFCIDNYSCVQTAKEYVAFPYTPKRATTYDFENLEAQVIGTNPTFTSADIAGTPYNVSKYGNTQECPAAAEIVADANGNNYFHMYGGKRVNSSDRGWGFNTYASQVETLVPAANANLGVLQFDIKLDKNLTINGAVQSTGSPLNLTFYFGGTSMSTNALRIDPIASGNDITFAGNKLMAFDEWYTVRFEFVSGENIINVYSKLQGADEWANSFTIASDYNAGTLDSYGQMSNISGGAFHGASFVGYNAGQMYSLSFDNMMTYSTYYAK